MISEKLIFVDTVFISIFFAHVYWALEKLETNTFRFLSFPFTFSVFWIFQTICVIKLAYHHNLMKKPKHLLISKPDSSNESNSISLMADSEKEKVGSRRGPKNSGFAWGMEGQSSEAKNTVESCPGEKRKREMVTDESNEAVVREPQSLTTEKPATPACKSTPYIIVSEDKNFSLQGREGGAKVVNYNPSLKHLIERAANLPSWTPIFLKNKTFILANLLHAAMLGVIMTLMC